MPINRKKTDFSSKSGQWKQYTVNDTNGVFTHKSLGNPPCQELRLFTPSHYHPLQLDHSNASGNYFQVPSSLWKFEFLFSREWSFVYPHCNSNKKQITYYSWSKGPFTHDMVRHICILYLAFNTKIYDQGDTNYLVLKVAC